MKQLTVFCMVVCVFISQSYADEAHFASEAKLKAIYLVHISKLTTWPVVEKNTDSFSICIDKTSEISTLLTEIVGRTVKNKKLKLEHDLTEESLIACDVYYVTASDYPIFKRFKSQLESHAVLTVSSEKGFSRDEGGIVEYYIAEEVKKVKMRVNLQNMRNSQLNISSKLLRLMDTGS
ncbi:MAG: DUF4154 domain-containing protein [Methylococcaceae bacterium]|nr:DUF4154 domain-containing protein [Methylococcaceae bacterium]